MRKSTGARRGTSPRRPRAATLKVELDAKLDLSTALASGKTLGELPVIDPARLASVPTQLVAGGEMPPDVAALVQLRQRQAAARVERAQAEPAPYDPLDAYRTN